ncbi:MAG: hypothetical protein LBR29_02205, partial [Methylobacteriaceae bacterium]|nr:hypothetical protein [Methylobacteriaceae bacterium]
MGFPVVQYIEQNSLYIELTLLSTGICCFKEIIQNSGDRYRTNPCSKGTNSCAESAVIAANPVPHRFPASSRRLQPGLISPCRFVFETDSNPVTQFLPRLFVSHQKPIVNTPGEISS